MPINFKQVERYQYVGLFVVLVSVLFVHPFLTNGRADWIVAVLVALIPAMAVVALVEHRPTAIVGIVLGVPATLALLSGQLGGVFGSGLLVRLLPLAFYGFATAVICYHVVTEPRVQADTLLGAICGYLMLGFTWSAAYGALLLVEPAAFYTAHGGAGPVVGDLFYFSFVTLTTLGYGDIVPLTAKARSLAMMESITGVLYLAVLVSRLVAMYRSVQGEVR